MAWDHSHWTEILVIDFVGSYFHNTDYSIADYQKSYYSVAAIVAWDHSQWTGVLVTDHFDSYFQQTDYSVVETVAGDHSH